MIRAGGLQDLVSLPTPRAPPAAFLELAVSSLQPHSYCGSGDGSSQSWAQLLRPPPSQPGQRARTQRCCYCSLRRFLRLLIVLDSDRLDGHTLALTPSRTEPAASPLISLARSRTRLPALTYQTSPRLVDGPTSLNVEWS
jgi:hypothetical protein